MIDQPLETNLDEKRHSPPRRASDLLASERIFVAAMSRLEYGRFEYVRIERGEVVLDPWPAGVRVVKFGEEAMAHSLARADCHLKRQVAELFEYTRDIEAGEIRTLEIRHGLPFSMEIEMAGGRHG